MKTFKQSIIAVVVGLAMAYGIGLAWTGPTANPAAGNVPAPINVGLLPQTFGDSSSAGSKTLNMGNGTGVLTVNGKITVNNTSLFKGAANFDGLTQFNQLATFNKSIKITDGTQGAAKVLTSDSGGNAIWKEPSLSLCYDSGTDEPNSLNGWLGIGKGADMARTLTHDCGTIDTIVYVEGKSGNGSIHQINFGSDGPTGLIWREKTATTIKIKRGADDINDSNNWKEVRVRMWKINK